MSQFKAATLDRICRKLYETISELNNFNIIENRFNDDIKQLNITLKQLQHKNLKYK